MKNIVDVSVIMVNYNTLRLTENAIESIFRQTEGLRFDVLLIDNASSDGSGKYFSERYGDRIRFIQSDSNLGFGKANNIGISQSDGKYVFFLNTDTVLLNNSIKILYEFMESNRDVGVCGGNLYDASGKPVHSFYPELISIRAELKELLGLNRMKVFAKKHRLDFNFSAGPMEVGYITGADMFVRRSVLNEVGGFDPDFFMYYEETELTSRIRRKGYRVVSVPAARIQHLEQKSKRFHHARENMMLESKYKYYEKVYGEKSVAISYWLSQVSCLLKFFGTFDSDYMRRLALNWKKYGEWVHTKYHS